MRLGYDDFKSHGAEVIAVTSTAPERGPQYHQVFQFAYPYLCDPAHTAARRFGVKAQFAKAWGGLVASAPNLVKELVGAPKNFHIPAHDEGRDLIAGQMDALFLVDKSGTIRFARAACGNALLPSNPELVEMLDKTASAA